MSLSSWEVLFRFICRCCFKTYLKYFLASELRWNQNIDKKESLPWFKNSGCLLHVNEHRWYFRTSEELWEIMKRWKEPGGPKNHRPVFSGYLMQRCRPASGAHRFQTSDPMFWMNLPETRWHGNHQLLFSPTMQRCRCRANKSQAAQ